MRAGITRQAKQLRAGSTLTPIPLPSGARGFRDSLPLEKGGASVLKGADTHRRKPFRVKDIVCVLPLCLAASADQALTGASRPGRRTAGGGFIGRPWQHADVPAQPPGRR